MNLDPELSAIVYALADREIRARRLNHHPIPYPLQRLHDHLTLQAQIDPEPASDPSPIGVTDAARIIGVSERRIRRIVADLEGYRIGHAWLFPRGAVEQYAAGRAQRRK